MWPFTKSKVIQLSEENVALKDELRKLTYQLMALEDVLAEAVPADTALSECRTGAFILDPRAQTAATSLSLRQLSVYFDMRIPVRHWARKIAKVDRNRFRQDLRRRLTTLDEPIDGIYKFETKWIGPKPFLVRTTLTRQFKFELAWLVMELSDANFAALRRAWLNAETAGQGIHELQNTLQQSNPCQTNQS